MFSSLNYLIFIILFFELLNFVCGKSISYSNPDFCDRSESVTQCHLQSSGPASHCTEYENTIGSEMDKYAILNRINSRRNKVAAGEIRSLPSAENMRKLEWNKELEKAAQRWADQCVRNGVPDKRDDCLDHGTEHIGQNIATVYGDAPGLAVQSLVDVWYMQLLSTNASLMHRYRPSNLVGSLHYDYFSQLVWAESSEVGCGAVQFKECVRKGDGKRNVTVHRLVCNFSPGGNKLSHPVYEQGAACSQCPIDYVCDTTYTSLCSRVRREDMKPVDGINLPFVDPQMNSAFVDATATDVSTTNATSPVDHNEEPLTPYDFFNNLRHMTMPLFSISTTTKKGEKICNNGLEVDEVVELLKKKLSSDSGFKDLINNNNKQSQSESTENGYSDSNVADFISRIYTSQVATRTTKLPDTDYVNSTLLADLVEAVIFRSAQKSDITASTTEIVRSANEIFPVKIQAELGEIKQNNDFTGHLFMPEQESEEKVTTPMEPFYDTFQYPEKNENIPISDILSEIANFRRNKATTDFLAEFFETDFTADVTSPSTVSPFSELNLNKIGYRNENNKDADAKNTHSDNQNSKRKKRSERIHSDFRNKVITFVGENKKNGKAQKPLPENFNREINSEEDSDSSDEVHTDTSFSIKYKTLLKKIARDLRFLKINEKFDCFRNSAKSSFTSQLLMVLCIYFIKLVLFN